MKSGALFASSLYPQHQQWMMTYVGWFHIFIWLSLYQLYSFICIYEYTHWQKSFYWIHSMLTVFFPFPFKSTSIPVILVMQLRFIKMLLCCQDQWGKNDYFSLNCFQKLIFRLNFLGYKNDFVNSLLLKNFANIPQRYALLTTLW
jgi:hypothetical protein